MLTLVSLALLVFAVSAAPTPAGADLHSDAKRCTGTISSFSDVANAVKCTTVNINAFTVPKGTTLNLDFLAGTTVNQLGDITFATGEDWLGPLAQITGTNINFLGNNYKWNGNGQYYWDGQGTNGGRNKPHPAIKIKTTGYMEKMYLLNAPAQGFSISNPGTLKLQSFTVDDAAGNSGGGHNTDGFDVSGSTGLTITGASVNNQDDCIAINDASSLTFSDNTCNGGHGISVGSIKTGKHVSGVTITGNTVTNSDQALRIKTYVGATNASVSDVTYTGNTGSGLANYGVIIEQDYTNAGATGQASNTVSIKNVNFVGSSSNLKVNSGAKQVYVLCGSGSCTGTWNWALLKTSGGIPGNITNAPVTGWKAG